MTLENCDTKSTKDNPSSTDYKDYIPSNPIPKRTEKHNLKKAASNNDHDNTTQKHHLPTSLVILLIALMLIVLGSCSYFYEFHKIIANKKLSVVKVDLSSYPKIKIHLKAEGFNYELDSKSFSVKEINTHPKYLNLINDSGNIYVLEYTSLRPSAKDSKVKVSIYYEDHNKFIDLKTDYTIKTDKENKKKSR